MNLSQYNTFCQTLPGSHTVVQWGGAHVWKVGGKMFAAAWDDPEGLQVTFKASDMGFEIMRDMPGLRPAPYMASRGLKWIQNYASPGLADSELKDHIRASYDMVFAKLTKKLQAEILSTQG